VAKNVYIETYGCQMNKADSELMAGLMSRAGYSLTDDIPSADVILVNTCAVREHAEERVLGRMADAGPVRRATQERLAADPRRPGGLRAGLCDPAGVGAVGGGDGQDRIGHPSVRIKRRRPLVDRHDLIDVDNLSVRKFNLSLRHYLLMETGPLAGGIISNIGNGCVGRVVTGPGEEMGQMDAVHFRKIFHVGEECRHSLFGPDVVSAHQGLQVLVV